MSTRPTTSNTNQPAKSAMMPTAHTSTIAKDVVWDRATAVAAAPTYRPPANSHAIARGRLPERRCSSQLVHVKQTRSIATPQKQAAALMSPTATTSGRTPGFHTDEHVSGESRAVCCPPRRDGFSQEVLALPPPSPTPSPPTSSTLLHHQHKPHPSNQHRHHHTLIDASCALHPPDRP